MQLGSSFYQSSISALELEGLRGHFRHLDQSVCSLQYWASDQSWWHPCFILVPAHALLIKRSRKVSFEVLCFKLHLKVMWCILSKLDVVFTSWLCLIGVSCRLGRGRSGSLLAGPVSYRVGSYKWHSAMWYKSFSVKIRCRKILKCHADLGRVQVAATLPTGPLCVQWRQQQLISGALF